MRTKRIISMLCLGSMLMTSAVGSANPCLAADAWAETAESIGASDVSESGTDFSFQDLSGRTFVFSSGAGAWATTLEIQSDGSFSGTYSDSDMGDTGDDYPNGTCYQCVFTGQFTQPEKVNDYTWSMQIDTITYEKEAGTEEIIDGVRYSYSVPYGLNDAQAILVYLPGAPLDELPEGYRSWITMNLTDTETTVLPFYGLYNEAQEQGFSSYNDSSSDMTKAVMSAAEQAAALETELNEGALSQSEMNQKSAELYQIWDDVLNEIWAELKTTLSEEEMSALTEEELQWISDKETAVSEAGAEFEGGSMQPTAENLKAASLTKERVYVLLDLL